MPYKIFFFILFILFAADNRAQQGLKVIYIIHSDGNYLFHDEQGRARDASERILSQAFSVGANLLHGEVFIFFQKPRENFLLFFPQEEGEFFYYKKGLRVLKESYSRKNSSAFEAESELIKKYSDSSFKYSKNILLYYGHEIPSKDTTGYYASQPDKKFGLNIFEGGLRQMANSFSLPGDKFDVIVLSTCKNGTYETAEKLSPFTDFLVASPKDIHLSYLNSESLINLSRDKNISGTNIAEEFAEYAFKEMCRITSTEVFLSVYELSKIISKNEPAKIIKNFYRAPKFGMKASSMETEMEDGKWEMENVE